MKIKRINIENFHGFEKVSFNLDNKFTLFIEENATSKTSILDALVVAEGVLYLILFIDKTKIVYIKFMARVHDFVY